MLTSIVIPTYNKVDLLRECIASIRIHTPPSDYELIVVDNGSRDGTVDYLRAERIPFISLPANEGFPVACNRGLAVAVGDALMVLNNDVLVGPRWLEQLVACLNRTEDVGIVGPVTNYASGRQQCPVPFTTLEEMASRFSRENKGKVEEVKRLVGLCFLFKRQVMETIGLFDEAFSPGHYEDDDYCYRARQAGYKLLVDWSTYIFHHGSASFREQDQSALDRLIAENRQKFIDKWGIEPETFH